MERMNWHRLFGLLLVDFFTKSPFVVELEKDLSLKIQRLDVIILRRRPGRFGGALPDGLDNLATHNLITFKSHHEALDDWALKELTGHYVNYRKQVSSSLEKLLPESEFRLYAVCSRYPSQLASVADLRRLQEGVYECRRGSDVIRVVVLRQLPQVDHNAVLHLLSATPELVGYGARHYQQRSADTSTLIHQLFEGFEREEIAVSYTMEDFRRDYAKEHFKDLTPGERRELFMDLTPAERRELLKNLSCEELDEIEKYLKRLKQEATLRKQKKRN
jgi:hypothetical protein